MYTYTCTYRYICIYIYIYRSQSLQILQSNPHPTHFQLHTPYMHSFRIFDLLSHRKKNETTISELFAGLQMIMICRVSFGKELYWYSALFQKRYETYRKKEEERSERADNNWRPARETERECVWKREQERVCVRDREKENERERRCVLKRYFLKDKSFKKYLSKNK